MGDADADPEAAGDLPKALDEEVSALVSITESRVFGAFFLWLIIANTVTMALYRPLERHDSDWNSGLETVEMIFLFIFTIEIVLKILAQEAEFFKDGWNKMDFVIVLSGYLVFLPGDLLNPSVFRTIRVLRPLRAIGLMPGVRVLIDALILSLPGLSTLMVLITFVFIVFGIMGLQLFMGSFAHHCVPSFQCVASSASAGGYLANGACNVTGPMATSACKTGTYCAAAVMPLSAANAKVVITGEYGFCRPKPVGDVNYPCKGTGLTCVPTVTPLHHGASSWDNIFGSMVIMFQIMTTEGWTTIFQPTSAMNEGYGAYAYFIMLIFATSFFMANFVLAEMIVAFKEAVKEQNNQRPPEKGTLDLIWAAMKPCFSAAGTFSASEDIWTMREIFNRLDDDESGELNDSEVLELSKELGMDFTLEDMDFNGDGSIGYPEFEQWWKMRAKFERFDTDNSGNLNEEEVAQLCEDLGIRKVTVGAMERNDEDEITFKTWAQWWNLKTQFDALDISGGHALDEDAITKLIENLGLGATFAKDDDGNVTKRMLSPAKFSYDNMASDDEDNVSYTEFEFWWRCRRTFDNFDTDNSGELDPAELSKVGESLGVEIVTTKSLTFEQFTTVWGDTCREAVAGSASISVLLGSSEGLRAIVTSAPFNTASVIAVLCNFVVMAYDHQGISDSQSVICETLNIAFTIIFAVEMVVKMAGLGLGDYFADGFNRLDCFIVITGIIELIMSGEGAMTVLRALRLIRVVRSLKVFQTTPALRRMMEATMKSAQSIGNFCVLLFFILVIFALVGMHLFGGEFRDPAYNPPGTFDNFYWAFLTAFQVLTRENWHALLYRGYFNSGWVSFAYFGSLIIVGNYMILSLFLGNLLFNVQEVFLAEAKRVVKVAKQGVANKVKRAQTRAESDVIQVALAAVTLCPKIDPTLPYEEQQKRAAMLIQRAWVLKRLRLLGEGGMQVVGETSCYIFERTHPLRKFCGQLATSPLFDSIILGAIIASSICLAVEHPLDDPDSTKGKLLFALDVIFTVMFVVEMLAKMLYYGLIMGEGTYLQDAWNVMDAIVTVVSVIGLLPAARDVKSLRVVRTFRVLRPIRTLRKFPELKVITETLLGSMQPIGLVLMIATFIISIFAIAAVSLQKGRLNVCSLDDPDLTGSGARPFTKFDACIAGGGTWTVDKYRSFDNVFYSGLVMFELVTLEDWQTQMYYSVDTTNTPTHDGQHTYEREFRGSSGLAICYVIFIIVGSFFFMQLVAGIVVCSFDMKKKVQSSGIEAIHQDQLRQTYMITAMAPVIAEGTYWTGVRLPCRQLIKQVSWDATVTLVIMANIFTMAIEHHDQPEWLDKTLWAINVAFTMFFTFEIGIKLIGYGSVRCFMDKWNVFDAFIVFAAIIELIVEFSADTTGTMLHPTVLRAFRIFRMTRVAKLAPNSDGLSRIFNTFALAVPVLLNVGFIMALVFFIYAVLGVQLFYNVKADVPGGEGFTDSMNYSDFWTTMFTLFVQSTGEHWNSWMHFVLDGSDATVPDAIVISYFVSFQTITTYLTLNLFISVIVAYTSNEHEHPTEAAPPSLSWEHCDTFIDAWAVVDPKCKGFITGRDTMVRLIMECGVPLGRDADTPETTTLRESAEQICDDIYPGGEVPQENFFSSVLHQLSCHAFKMDPDDEGFELEPATKDTDAVGAASVAHEALSSPIVPVSLDTVPAAAPTLPARENPMFSDEDARSQDKE